MLTSFLSGRANAEVVTIYVNPANKIAVYEATAQAEARKGGFETAEQWLQGNGYNTTFTLPVGSFIQCG